MKNKFIFTLSILLLSVVITFGQTIQGVVVDGATKEPLVGATIFSPSDVSTGTVTDAVGRFILKTSGKSLIISHLGYVTDTVKAPYRGMIELLSSNISLEEIKIVASSAIDRKTPVAFSSIKPKEISENYGSRELPELLNITPAVYATKSGGGIGDSRINIRGFDQRNVAVLVNGIPVNDMENGWVYWSNWAGLGDALSEVQVQRGLGASKLAINSVGGTINLITKSTEAKRSSFFQADATDYGRLKVLGGYNSGRMADNSAFSIVLSTTQGNGYVKGTDVNAFSYFLSYSKEIGDNHKLVFTGIGAPQTHGQRDRMLTREEVDQFGNKYNKDLGLLDGEELNQRINYYHKPQFAVNHYWDISPKSSLKTSAYFSFGHGGGSGPLGQYAPVDKENGLINFNALRDRNVSLGNSVGILRNSVNNHTWVGVLSTYDTKLSSTLELKAGLDARKYKGEHFREVRNLLGGDQWIERYRYAVDGVANRDQRRTLDDNSTSYWNTFSVTPEGNRIAYDNDGKVSYIGGFGQLEYTSPDDKLTAFLTSTLSTTGNTRIDRYNYAKEENQKSETVNKVGYNFKVGANYNINDKHNVFINTGRYSRAPFFSFIFQNYQNVIADNLINEKVNALEVGYGYKGESISLKGNAYITRWFDKSLLSGRIPTEDGGTTRALVAGIGALHKGIELEFNSKPLPKVDLGGMLSVGDWKWKGDVRYQLRSDIDQSITTGYAYTDGLKVGNAPQTQVGVKIRYQITPSIDVGSQYVYNDRLYADYNPADYTRPQEKAQPYQLDSYGLWDLRAGIKVGGNSYFQVQVYNLLNFQGFVEGINDSSTTLNNSAGEDIKYGFPSWGRNANFSFRTKF